MPTRCQDCNASFLLDGTTVVNGISCPDCGGTRLERDQPSPTHSDGELRNMVDPATQLDQGGNPLQEGVWAGVDGGWQPAYKRDEFFAKTAGSEMWLPPSGIEPQYHGQATKHPEVGLHAGNLFWLQYLDASINGKPVREHADELFTEHGMTDDRKPGTLTVSVHHPEHLPAAIEAVENPHLNSRKSSLAFAPTLKSTGAAIAAGQLPPPPGIRPAQQQAAPPVMSHYDRALSQEPYLPWYHQADVKRYPGDGGEPVTLTNDEWAADKKRRYHERALSRGGHQLNWQPGQQGRGIMVGGSLHTWPVEKTMENPQGGLRHGEYISSLGVNPAAVNMQLGFEIEPDGRMTGKNIPPQATQIDPFLNHGPSGEDWNTMFAATKQGIAPLLAVGGRLLLGQALGGLMRKAIGGAGNFLNQTPQPEAPMGGRPIGLVASEHTAVGVAAPVETPGSVPDMVEDHDPEAVDQQEFNDGDTNPAFNNPNNDDADAGMAQSTGEDGMHQKLEFRHDGDAVSQAELLLPLIMEFINSEKSGLENPQIKALHEALEAEIPGYLDHADENGEEVQKFLEELKKPEHVHAMTKEGYGGEATMPANHNPQADFIEQARRMVEYYHSIGDIKSAQMYQQMVEQAEGQQGRGYDTLLHPTQRLSPDWKGVASSTKEAAPVYQGTPMPQAQMQMGQGQMAMPGTHANPVQPGGMPVSGKCMNCGGVVNADGSCPQCGAAAGANQMGNMQQQPGQAQTPVGIMPSPYAKTASTFKCSDCGTTFESDEESPGLCPNCDSDVLQHVAADHQGPITPQQKQVFADYLIEQGRNAEVAAMMANPGMYADEWALYLNKSTQPPEVDPAEQAPMPQVPPEQMGQMPVPPMSIPQPTGKTATNPRRCPKCESATTSLMNSEGDIRCHRCGNVWQVDVTEDHPVVKSNWVVKSYQDSDAPNPVATPAADATAPGDREQQADSTLSWQSADGTPLQVGQTYEMHNPGYAIPDVVKVQQVKPDSIVVTMEGEYNSPTDPQDANGPGYTHEITLQELQQEGLTFNPVQTGEGEQEQSQDQNEQDGIGQTVNTEPVEQPHGDFPLHANFVRMAPMSEYDQYFGGESGAAAKAKAAMIKQYGEKKGEEVFYATVNKKKGGVEQPTDQCPKCAYTHVTSSYTSPTEVAYECFRCAHQWRIADLDEDNELNPESREWIKGDDDEGDSIGFDPRALAMASSGQGRNIRDIAKRDPRHAEIHERLNKNAGAKFSPREQKEFIDEEGTARNADRLNLEGTHYVESAFDNSKARPDRVNDNYIGLGL